MQTSLIITLSGPDHVGLVKSISEVLSQHNASWTESRMSHLGGKFAGLLLVSLPTDGKLQLLSSLDSMQTEALKITVEELVAKGGYESLTKILNIELLGQDRSGIILDVTRQLATLNVNIDELESEVKPASMSGGTLFGAKLKLGVPEDISSEEVQELLESMSDQFMVDIGIS